MKSASHAFTLNGMTLTYESVLEHALQLPVVERSRIATRLIESVEEPEETAEVSSAWQAEIDRRMESIRNGTAKLVCFSSNKTLKRETRI